MSIYGKGPRGKATRIHGQIVRARGACEGPDAWKGRAVIHSQRMECAHIISRRFSGTRTDLDNAFCLCNSCHRFFTEHPVDFADFAIDKMGRASYEALWQKAHAVTKMDWVAEAARLDAIWKSIKAAA